MSRKLAIVGKKGSRTSVSPTVTAPAVWPLALLVPACEKQLGLGRLWLNRCPNPPQEAHTGMPTILTGAHHGVGEEFLWLRHWHALPQGAGGDDYHKHRTNTQLLTSPAGHATAAPGSYRRPGCASQHLPALSVKHKPGHAGHQPPAQPTGFHPCCGHQGLARTLVTTEALLQHWGWCNCLSVCCAAPAWCEPGHSG